MAVQGTGLGKGSSVSSMRDPTSFDARSGAAKKPQTSYETKWGMKDRDGSDATNEDAGPSNPGTGPAAVEPNPLDGGIRKDIPTTLEPKWGMKDGHGRSLDSGSGGRVLGEAILSGASTLPSGESYGDAKPVRQPG